jgi:uncharacterized membrane protein
MFAELLAFAVNSVFDLAAYKFFERLWRYSDREQTKRRRLQAIGLIRSRRSSFRPASI